MNTVMDMLMLFHSVHCDCLNLEDGTDRLSRNVGTELQLYAA
jgi:hypothetical protein